MVAVLHGAPESASPEALAAWNAQVGHALAPAERDVIAAVADYARALYGDRRTADGEPWLDRALATAAIVAGLKLDADSVRAAAETAARRPRARPITTFPRASLPCRSSTRLTGAIPARPPASTRAILPHQAGARMLILVTRATAAR